jgi:Ca-activated chloride channel family protein
MKRSIPELLDEELSLSRRIEEDVEAGFGALRTERGCLPLRALDVQARIDGLIVRVELTQTFVNAHAEALEATYIFPLPDRAAVTRFRLEVAGRVIDGELRERGAARQEYDQAVEKGHRAAITEEERPGVFTMRVGNLPAGEEAIVRLTLTGPLPFSDGEATFRFPLVVAPRYIPGVSLPGPSVGDGMALDTDAVPDASRISPPVLLPGFPNPVRLGLAVEVPLSSLAPSDFRSSLHTVIESEDNETKLFRLQPGERFDRDFILRFRVGRERIVSSLTLQPDREGQEGTFLLTLVPPARQSVQKTGRDVVFVLDRSGSMAGWKMVAARRALARMVDTLTEQDRFTVYAFDDSVETLPECEGNGLVPATDRLRFRAIEFLARIDARGGTEMAQPLKRAVKELSQEKRAGRERILVLVTDGQVGNEDQILRQLGPNVKELRIFTLGIDPAVNAAFLRLLADLGGGRSEVVESEDRLDDVMDGIHRHIGTPVLTGLCLEPAGLRFLPDSVVPGRMPDLFAGTPLLITGRYRGEARGSIALQARDAAGKMWSEELLARRVDNPALTTVWARGRLREMEDRYAGGVGDRTALECEIVSTSLRFGVLCRFTAFVAVDRTEVVNPGGRVHGVVQPVEQPSGWRDRLSLGTSAAPVLGGMVASDFELSARLMPNLPPPASPVAGCTDYDAVEDAAESVVESVDSMLMEFDDDGAYAYRKAAPASGPKGIKRLLSVFTGTKRRKKVGPSATLDRAPFRLRALDVLQTMQAMQSIDAARRLTVLQGQAPKLEELFENLVAAGDRDPAVKALGESVIRLYIVLADTNPAETDILGVWTQIENALRRWLALGETARIPPREGFWK